MKKHKAKKEKKKQKKKKKHEKKFLELFKSGEPIIINGNEDSKHKPLVDGSVICGDCIY